ncbi:MAG: hypothetical protein K2L81_07660, partial [Muribaculaceae bacterium]|nr:hypothetical protein [Muribaculaceae bacterium]
VAGGAGGCDATLYVYDRLDQLMMSQDPIQRASDQWTVIKRDLKRRPAVVGRAKIAGASRGSLQALYGDTILYESRLPKFDKSTMGYTSSSGPAGFTPLSATFYDDYSFYPVALPQSPNGFSLNDRHPGTSLPTGWACMDADGNAYVGATFYDKKGRSILSLEQDADGRIYRLEQWARHSFRGLVTDRMVSVTDITRQAGHAVTYKYIYDDAEQLVSTKMSVDADGELTLSTMGYDGIGRITSKRIGSVDVSYGYDVRSHLTSIESAPYTQRAYHGISPVGPWKGSFNGNIVAQSDSLGLPGEARELTLFKYDHAGRLVQSVPADTSAVGAMAENFEWDCNSNLTYIQRMWNNAAVQDAAVSYQGNRITGVNDVSDDTYMGSVPQFPGGSYAMTYDASGRLTSDGTRSIRKITYHDWGDLPRHISFTGGGAVVANYRADGALVERREYEPLSIAATLGLTAFDKEPITPGIGGGEIAGIMVGRRRYFGPWEHVDGSGWLLHTPEGVYDLARHEHYWHVRDRLGSVRAVVDKSGAVVQATRYFASGVPVRVDVDGGRRVSDRGHIGNRWVAHAGLDWYDNSARMHDPLLARFTTMDPFHDKYTQYSPYSHCAGNPVNHVDYDGREWKKIKDDEGRTINYEWVDKENAYDSDGNLLPDVFKSAIIFTACGEDGKKFNPSIGKNMGTSIAIVFGLSEGDVSKYNACTYPSDLKNCATVPAGEYEAVVGLHRKQYSALRLSDIGTKDFTHTSIELGRQNPSKPNKQTTKATGINIHKAGNNNYTGKYEKNNETKYVSEGCILIDIYQWDDFMSNFKEGIKIRVTVHR